MTNLDIQAIMNFLSDPKVVNALQNLISGNKSSPEQKESSAICKFSQKELNKMPQTFKKLFKIGKIVAKTRKKPNGVYEIRVCVNGVNYSASSKNYEIAKEKFITALMSGTGSKTRKKDKLSFNDYFLSWLEKVKKPYIKESTYKSYLSVYNTYLREKFGNSALCDVNAMSIQTYLNDYAVQGKFRTAKKIKVILTDFFKYAKADGKIELDPTSTLRLVAYEPKSGSPITRTEESALVSRLISTREPYCQAHVFLIYTGLRVGELASVKIDGDWVIAVTEKQRYGKSEKIRKIPVSPILKKLLPYINVSYFPYLSADSIARHVKDLLPNHHTHDLRHTFVTRCRECDIRREIVSMWVGHSADSSITSTIYTHLDQNEDIQLKEIKKFDYELQ